MELDTAKVAGLIVVGALLFIAGVSVAFKGSVHF
jgi:hypothetical protein